MSLNHFVRPQKYTNRKKQSTKKENELRKLKGAKDNDKQHAANVRADRKTETYWRSEFAMAARQTRSRIQVGKIFGLKLQTFMQYNTNMKKELFRKVNISIVYQGKILKMY